MAAALPIQHTRAAAVTVAVETGHVPPTEAVGARSAAASRRTHGAVGVLGRGQQHEGVGRRRTASVEGIAAVTVKGAGALGRGQVHGVAEEVVQVLGIHAAAVVSSKDLVVVIGAVTPRHPLGRAAGDRARAVAGSASDGAEVVAVLAATAERKVACKAVCATRSRAPVTAKEFSDIPVVTISTHSAALLVKHFGFSVGEV